MTSIGPYLPPIQGSWNEWAIVSRGKPWPLAPREYAFPVDYTPSRKFALVSEFANTTIWPGNLDLTMMNIIGWSPVASAAGMNITMTASLRRMNQSMVLGFDAVPYIYPSPRFGFNIGRMFKFQHYERLDVVALGYVAYVSMITWYWATAIPMVEFFSYSRFKQAYVRHGRILGVRKDSSGNYFIKVIEKSGKPRTGFAPGGTIKYWDGNGTSGSMNVGSIEDTWEIKVSAPSSGPSLEPSPGMFFVLSNPWAVEDPRLMHEFDLDVDDQGFYKTHEQKFSFKHNRDARGDFVGIWIPPAAPDTKYKCYMNDDKRGMISLPVSEAEALRWGESMEFGGQLEDGITAFNALSPKPSSVRVTLSDAYGDTANQNLYAQNLVGEFIEMNGEYYEITGHPRSEAIDVKQESVTNKNFVFLTEINRRTGGEKPKFTVYQQHFWMISEIYPYAEGLWIGELVSSGADSSGSSAAGAAATSTVVWKGSDGWALKISGSEEARTGSKTLADRFWKEAALSGTAAATVKEGFRKFSGWTLRCTGNSSVYPIQKITREETGATVAGQPEYKFKATVEGDITGSPLRGEVYVMLDEPYRGAYTSANYGNPFAFLEVAPSLDVNMTPVTWKLFMSGYMCSGYYDLDRELTDQDRISLCSWSYGYDGTYMGKPAIWAATEGALSSVAFVEHGPANRQYVFYRDPSFNVEVYRQGATNWVEQRQQNLVRFGFPTKYDAPAAGSGGGPTALPDDAYLVGAAWFSIPGESPVEGAFSSAYWLYVPDNILGTGSPYFGQPIGGQGGVETPLTKKLSMTPAPTSAIPVVLPFEFYSPVGASGSGGTAEEKKVKVGAYFRANEKSWEAGLEKITTSDKLDLILRGGFVSKGTIAPTIKSIEVSKMTEVLKNPGVVDVFSSENSTMTLVYGKRSPKFFPVGASSSTATDGSDVNEPKDCVWMIRSSRSGDTWGSPKFDESYIMRPTSTTSPAPGSSSTNPTEAEKKEWARPLMLLYDFTFAGSLIDPYTNNCYVFGYAYARNAEDKPMDGDEKYMFLGMYRFSLGRLKTDTTYPLYEKLSSGSADGSPFAYYRCPYASQDTTPDAWTMKFGPKLSGTFSASMAPPHSERFCRIAGGESSGAIITNLAFQKDIIAAEGIEGGLRIYIRDVNSGGIVALLSKGSGNGWEVEKYEESTTTGAVTTTAEKPLVYIKGGRAPCVHSPYMFFFDDNKLWCKRQMTEVTGTYASIQELFNAESSVVIASDVKPHRIAANTDPSGVTTVFYLKSGYATASYTSDGGRTWLPLRNW